MDEENLIWTGRPSQWVNFDYFLVGFLLCFLVIPIFIAIWRYLVVRTWNIEITDQRIIEQKGVFSRTTDEIELYRVKDLRLEEPFLLRLVGLSNIQLTTSDHTHRIYRIPALHNGQELREQLRVAVDVRRDKKGVTERDYE